uniref:C-C motif chemokine n=1 Tax=Gouania willdenowi TaxID=441366 RepID=A0A8C5GYS5_GOUWI
MKSSVIVSLCRLLLLLLTVFFISAASAYHGKGSCCFKTYTTKIKLNQLKTYYVQQKPACFVDAVVFITVAGKKICADPKNNMTRKKIAYLDNMNKAKQRNS